MTKLETFDGRGASDYLASHDLEDIITVIDGRAEIIDEITVAPEDVREYISGKVAGLMKTRQFLDALLGYLLPRRCQSKTIKNLDGTPSANCGNESVRLQLILINR